MKKTDEIRAYFENDRSFLAGVLLYNRYGKNQAMLQRMNMKGETPATMEKLHYQLWKLSEIPQAEWNKIMSKPPIPSDPKEKIKLIPEEVVKTVKLRDEFPFLKEKDCPRAFKILVNDMLTAYETYKAAHPKLLDADTEEEISRLSIEVVQNYLENRKIWDELNHYNEKKEILGEHPIFSELIRQDELEKKGTPELVKLEKSLKNKINRTSAEIKKGDKPHLNKERQERVDSFEIDYRCVKRLLGL